MSEPLILTPVGDPDFTLRDLFALVALSTIDSGEWAKEDIAEGCYAIADEFMKARKNDIPK